MDGNKSSSLSPTNLSLRSCFRSFKGSTLLEILVALGVVTTVAVGLSQYYSQASSYKKKLRAVAAMESLGRDIQNKLKSPSAIYLSTLDEAHNRDLIKCLVGALDGCDSRLIKHNPESPHLFALLYPTKKDAYEQMTSGPGHPIYYSLNGVPCKNNKDQGCVFEAHTFFYATCPKTPGLAVSGTCTEGAQELHLGYQVSQRKGTLPDLGAGLPSIPPVVQFTTMTAEQIFGPSYHSECNLGATINGYNSSGKAICQCSLPYEPKTTAPLSNRRGPLCRKTTEAELTCSRGLVFRGLQSDGKPDCRKFEESYDCIAVSGIEAQNMGTCGTRDYANYWITVNEKSDCSFHCTVAKGGGACYSDENLGVPNPITHMVKKQLGSTKREVKEGLICETRVIRCCKPR